jgi:hypothetical protein
VSADFKRELVVTDADVVTVGEIRAGADSLTLYLDTVGRPQIRDKKLVPMSTMTAWWRLTYSSSRMMSLSARRPI